MSDQCHSDVKSSLPQRVRLGVCNMGSLVTDRRPETTPGKDAILEQLERLLAHPAFKSKRCLTLLRYVVEHTFPGRANRSRNAPSGWLFLAAPRNTTRTPIPSSAPRPAKFASESLSITMSPNAMAN